jgi:hypothetical protein
MYGKIFVPNFTKETGFASHYPRARGIESAGGKTWSPVNGMGREHFTECRWPDNTLQGAPR